MLGANADFVREYAGEFCHFVGHLKLLGVDGLNPIRTAEALFKEFADAEPTDRGKRQFSARLSLLTKPAEVIGELPALGVSPINPRDKWGDGEDKTWSRNVLEMKVCVRLLEHAASNDDKAILGVFDKPDVSSAGICVRCRPSDVLAQRFPAGLFSPDALQPVLLPVASELAPALELPSVTSWAYAYVMARVNEKLRRFTASCCVWDRRSRTLNPEIIPLTLIGCLWLQFLDAAREGRRFERCRRCDGWFEVPRKPSRYKRRFCSDACRIRDYRLTSEALRLKKQRRSHRDIAEAIGVSEEEVKRLVVRHRFEKGAK